MKEIYVISGHTGNYEHHLDWLAFAVFSEVEAVLVTEQLNLILSKLRVFSAVENLLSFQEIYVNKDAIEAAIRSQTLDVKFQVDDGGSFYDYEKVNLITGLKEIK